MWLDSAQGLKDQKSGFWYSWGLPGGSKEESLSRLTQVTGRSNLVVRAEMPFSLLSLSLGLPSVSRSCVPSLSHGFLHLQSQNENRLHVESELDKSYAHKSFQRSPFLYL